MKSRLFCLQNKRNNDHNDDILCILLVKDEIKALPFLLKYYRDIGVDHFYVVDDHSKDGTLSFLLKQNDCSVFQPREAFNKSRQGMAWVQELMDTYAINNWVLKVDADELFVVPYIEDRGLKKYCAFLDQEGSDAVFVYMLDLYSDKGVRSAECVPDVPFYEICPYFDKDYKFFLLPFLRKPQHNQPIYGIHGGPRLRRFYKDQIDTRLPVRIFNWMKWKVNQFSRFLGKGPVFSSHPSPTLDKIGLVKWRRGLYHKSCHEINGRLSFSGTFGVFLHFKLFKNFFDRASDIQRRSQYHNAGEEYKRYLDILSVEEDINFMYSGSIRYDGSKGLLHEGLIGTTPDWDKFVI